MKTLRPFIRNAFRIVAILSMLIFFSGIVPFYDATISARDGGFYGKWGIPHSKSQYKWFKRWETAIMVLWASVFVLFGLRHWSDPEWRASRIGNTWKSLPW